MPDHTHFVCSESAAAVLRIAQPDAHMVPIDSGFDVGPCRREPSEDGPSWLARRSDWLSAYFAHRPLLDSPANLAAGLARAREHPPHIWVGHDTRDQLFLCWLATELVHTLGSDVPIRVSTAADAIQMTSPTEVLDSPTRELERDELRVLLDTWHAFVDTTPETFVRTALAAKGEPLHGLLWRLSTRLPSAANGLTHWEQLFLESYAAHDDIKTARRLGHVLVESFETSDGVGDLTLFIFLGELADQGLLERLVPGRTIRDAVFRITALGRDVLAGKLHRFDVAGYDRWFGGTHIRSDVDPWVLDGDVVRRREA